MEASKKEGRWQGDPVREQEAKLPDLPSERRVFGEPEPAERILAGLNGRVSHLGAL